jgi:hypothetical protein
VIDGFVGSGGAGEFDRTTRNGVGRAQLNEKKLRKKF